MCFGIRITHLSNQDVEKDNDHNEQEKQVKDNREPPTQKKKRFHLMIASQYIGGVTKLNNEVHLLISNIFSSGVIRGEIVHNTP